MFRWWGPSDDLRNVQTPGEMTTSMSDRSGPGAAPTPCGWIVIAAWRRSAGSPGSTDVSRGSRHLPSDRGAELASATSLGKEPMSPNESGVAELPGVARLVRSSARGVTRREVGCRARQGPEPATPQLDEVSSDLPTSWRQCTRAFFRRKSDPGTESAHHKPSDVASVPDEHHASLHAAQSVLGDDERQQQERESCHYQKVHGTPRR